MRPELHLSADWPDEAEWWLSDLSEGPSLTLYWPVSWLPQEMGYCHNAVTIPGDPTGGYYLLVGVAFYREYVGIYGCEANPDGYYPEATLDYPTLLHLIEQADTGVVGSLDPPPAMRLYRPHGSRTYRAWLRLVRARTSPVVAPDAEADDLPF